MSRLLSTCLTRDYISSWGVAEAVREVVQNALDTESYDFETSGDEIVIKSYGGTIDVKNLLPGVGSKRNSTSSRGGFSEGLLLALLILERDGVDFTFINGDKKWTPVFDFNDDYECETLFILEEDSEEDFDGVCITLNLDHKTSQKVIDNTLSLQEDYEKFETEEGTILLSEEHAGKIYVGGLFVDRFISDYGFDFKPEDFKLDRDRRSLAPFDIQWQVRNLIGLMEEDDLTEDLSDRIVGSIEKNDRSMYYLDETIICENSKLINSAEKVHKEKYDGKLVVSDYKEARDLEKAGNTNVEYVENTKLVSLIQKTESYKTLVTGKVEPTDKDLTAMIEDFENNYGGEMSDEMFEAWEELRNKLNEEI